MAVTCPKVHALTIREGDDSKHVNGFVSFGEFTRTELMCVSLGRSHKDSPRAFWVFLSVRSGQQAHGNS